MALISVFKITNKGIIRNSNFKMSNRNKFT